MGMEGREILKRALKVSQTATAVFKPEWQGAAEGEGTRPSLRRVSQYT